MPLSCFASKTIKAGQARTIDFENLAWWFDGNGRGSTIELLSCRSRPDTRRERASVGQECLEMDTLWRTPVIGFR